jgi:hypothetical protein
MDAGRDRRRQPGLEVAAAARREPIRLEAERALKLMAAAQLCGLVTVERHVQRAAAVVAGIRSAQLFQLGDEARVALGRSQRQLEQPLLAEGQLTDRGQHPGGGTGGPRGGSAAVENDHVEAALGRTPGAGQPDHAGADDNRVEASLFAR